MKIIKLFILTIAFFIGQKASAQELPTDVMAAIKKDDVTKVSAFVTKDNINACYGNYSILSHAARYRAKKCMDMLLEKGADANKICNDYVPPLMHAVKYGDLEMVKKLVAKGADVNYKYTGENNDVKDFTPVTYAERFEKQDIVDYLKSLQKK